MRAIALRRGLIPAAAGLLNAAGLGPFDKEMTGSALRRAGIAAMCRVVERLEIDASWVIYGHTHRAGPLLHRGVAPTGWESLPADGADGPAAGAVAAEVPAGGAVVFSSLTPHLTGPNATVTARKAYIVQYGPVGMAVVEGDWQAGGEPTGTVPCDDPDRQFPVLRGGRPV